MSTPMILQYEKIKKENADCLLFFRLGDFYELFGDDAIIASKLLEITLTSRHKGEGRVPMCGVPYHSVDGYLTKLTKLGKKVAICEQMTDPKLPGLVEREVVRIVTPGTTFDANILDQKANNYLIALTKEKDNFGLSFSDVTTGEFFVVELSSLAKLESEIFRLRPSECIITPELKYDIKFLDFLDKFEFMNISSFSNLHDPYKLLTEHFHVKNLEGFGIEKMKLGIQSSGLLFDYLKNTQKTDLSHFTSLKRYTLGDYMFLDEATLRNLELLFSIRDASKEGSLISVIDQTVTSMGGRLLRNFLIHPLLDEKKINERLEGVDELFKNFELTSKLREFLKKILDIERIVGKIGCQTVNARDMIGLKISLQELPAIKEILKNFKTPILKKADTLIQDFDQLTDLLEKVLNIDPPFQLKDGDIIKDGYNEELDSYRKISREGKNFIKNLQQKEIERSKIPSLKIRFNNVFGYYIEITKSHLKKVPSDYIRKQTLVNAERFITPELKEYEEKVLNAEEKTKGLEYNLFIELRNHVAIEIPKLKMTADSLSLLDVLANFAEIAKNNNYVKPQINSGHKIFIKNGRHPVIEKMTFSHDFVANDTFIDNEKFQLNLLTGPNMSGKSTYLRQVALIVLMAQIGSFVPATNSEIGVVDRIFTRVGASDNLARGQSTFMVEMQEAANILHNATTKSLIILDEIGRGTSTYDGVSIAWAITEYIHDMIKAKTIFATHYHELTPLVDRLERGRNLCVSVIENKKDGVVFLHTIVEGTVDKSYGVEVAKLAGLPKEVTKRAEEVLKNLEEGVIDKYVKKEVRNHRKIENEKQVSMFEKIF